MINENNINDGLLEPWTVAKFFPVGYPAADCTKCSIPPETRLI